MRLTTKSRLFWLSSTLGNSSCSCSITSDWQAMRVVPNGLTSARLSDLGKGKTGCQYYLSGLRSLNSAVCPFATSAAASEKSAAGRNAGDSCRHSSGLNAAIF